MATFDPSYAQSTNTAASIEPCEVYQDQALMEQLNAQVREAAERETFHRIEVERWARVGRASAAALVELQAAQPVPKMTPEGYLPAEAQRLAEIRPEF